MSKSTRRKRKADDRNIVSSKNLPHFRAACVIVARKYCDMFAFWRACRYKPCRSARRCIGDQSYCLEKRWSGLPYEVQRDAEMRMPTEAPPNADWLLRAAYHYDLHNLCGFVPSDRAKAEAKRRHAARKATDDAGL